MFSDLPAVPGSQLAEARRAARIPGRGEARSRRLLALAELGAEPEPEAEPEADTATDAAAEGRDVGAPSPAPPPSVGEALSGIEKYLRRFVVLARPEALVAVVLWVAHTYAVEHAEATPYLAISSPEKQSGKTRLLECLTLLAHDCDGIVITPTASTIFRTLEATPEGTMLLDELDAVFRDHSDKYEEVRAVINAGHRRRATVPRSVPGPRHLDRQEVPRCSAPRRSRASASCPTRSPIAPSRS